MRWVVDLLYLIVVIAAAPVWLTRMVRTGKIRTDWAGRLGRARLRPARGRRILVHAVSVGEVNAIRRLIDRLAAADPAPDLVISSTTDTGCRRAAELFGASCQVVRYPLDFSSAVSRFLRRVAPDAVVLVELEVWPNFVAASTRRGVPVCVVNGRLTQRSSRRYAPLGRLLRPTFRRLRFVAAQNEAYARRFEALGVPRERILVTGTMKWDTAEIADSVEGAEDLAAILGIDRTRPLVVAGSTAPGEHELLRDAVPEGVQLLCAPRRPEWFDQAAEALPSCTRRSDPRGPSPTGRYLLDSIGELRRAYALADVVVIGRTFGALHGSDMMEPVALGKAVIVGPAVSDFADTVEALLAGDGIVQTDAARLRETLRSLLEDPRRRHELATSGRKVIRAHQGATERTARLILSTVEPR